MSKKADFLLICIAVIVSVGGILVVHRSVTKNPYRLLREIPQNEIRDLLPDNYTSEFYEYVEDIRFYLILKDKVREPWWKGWQKAAFQVTKDGIAEVYIYDFDEDIGLTLAHEVGHYVNQNQGTISNTWQFRRAVFLSIQLMGATPCEGDCLQWMETLEEVFDNYPGILGRDVNEFGWGGYAELYSDLFQESSIQRIPPPLQKYYTPFLLRVEDLSRISTK